MSGGAAADDLVLALDQGGHASRAIAFDAAGAIVASAAAPIETRREGSDRVEHDAEEIVRSLERAITAVAAQLGPRVAAVGAAGLAVQRSTVACWDRVSGAALAPAISWQDRRAAAWVDEVAPGTPVREITGLVPSPHYGAGKLRWWLDHDGAVQSALAVGRLAWGPLASYLVARLCAERPHLVEPGCAARTMLWDRGARTWSAPLLARFGLPPQPLPRCVPSRHEFGRISLGGRRVPLRVVAGDQAAAVFAEGALESGLLRVNAGTGAFVLWPLAAGAGDDRAPRLLRTVLVQLSDDAPPLEALEGTVNGAGSAIDAQARAVGVDPTEAARRLDEWLDAAPRPPLFLNGIGGLGSPFWQPTFVSRFVGAEGAAPPERLAAVAESIVFLIAENVAHMIAAGAAPRAILFSGGLARADGLARRLASMTGVPVVRSAAHEATAVGLAQLVRSGADAPARSAPAAPVERFAPAPDAALADRYAQWRRAMNEDR